MKRLLIGAVATLAVAGPLTRDTLTLFKRAHIQPVKD